MVLSDVLEVVDCTAMVVCSAVHHFTSDGGQRGRTSVVPNAKMKYDFRIQRTVLESKHLGYRNNFKPSFIDQCS